MKILVTGANGQLGSELRFFSSFQTQHQWVFTDLKELDLSDLQSLESNISKIAPCLIINCAAYTSVDKAESENELANILNFKAVDLISKWSSNNNKKLIHISTDYVFDGSGFLPYQESDSINPIGVYGKTKRIGELAVINGNIDGIVIRTSWLYSAYGTNFVKTMRRLGKERNKLDVIYDQLGTPTNASDLAKTCLDILAFSKETNINAKGNVYHYSNEGVASWYDFAKAIMELGEIECEVRPVETKNYPTAAKRPHFSVLNKAKIKNDFEIEIPYWRASLARCISKLNQE